MKKLVLISFFALLLFSCGNQKNTKQTETIAQAAPEAVVLTVDDLYEKAADLSDKEIIVKGTVMHVCTHGGQRCFIMGSNEDITIRIEAGEKIGAFSQELMGSEIEVIGVLKEVKTEADAHNPGAHAAGEQDEDAETTSAHNIIAKSQEAAETVYFIEGIKTKEL